MVKSICLLLMGLMVGSNSIAADDKEPNVNVKAAAKETRKRSSEEKGEEKKQPLDKKDNFQEREQKATQSSESQEDEGGESSEKVELVDEEKDVRDQHKAEPSRGDEAEGAEFSEQPPEKTELIDKEKDVHDQYKAESSEGREVEVVESSEQESIAEEKKPRVDEDKADGEEEAVEGTEASMPEKAEEGPSLEEMEGIDTVDVEAPAGNWLLKRIWWEQAKDKFNKIRLAVNQIADAPMKFFVQQNEFEKTTLDKFYREIGLEQGELQEVVRNLIDQMNQEREEQGMLNLEERDIIQNLASIREKLEQLDKDAEVVNELDVKLDDALALLLKQTSQARNYENQAWQYFDAIAHELSDQKAQELYYNMDALLKDIKKIREYIQKDFAEYFNKIIDATKDSIARIKDSIDELSEEGVNLKTQLEGHLDTSKEIKNAKEPAEEDGEKKKLPNQDQQGWLARFWQRLFGTD